MRAREWSEQDERKLREIFPIKSNEEVAATLGRSTMAIATKASKMGLKKSFPAGIVWTDEQLKLLKKYFPTMFNRDLATLLRVSLRTLNRKASELGLTKTDTFFEDRHDDICRRASKKLKKMYASGQLSCTFRKGERSNPDGEFKPGYVESPETKKRRSEALKKSWARRKLEQRIKKVYGI